MKSCRGAWEEMTLLTEEKSVRDYTQTIDMQNYLVETEMFPQDVLEAYSSYNLENPIPDSHRHYFNEARGGKQGDYRQGMKAKIKNVTECLKEFPKSKRALITICNNPSPSHHSDDDAKCMREIHFYIEGGKLCASVLFRAQAAQIFPKNIHFIGSLMSELKEQLDLSGLGTLFYHTSVLVSDRA